MSDSQPTKKRLIRSVNPIAWAFLVVLIVASGTLILARSERETYPAIDAIRPSGLKLFADLLISDGYEVSSDRYVNPNIADADLVICVNIVPGATIFDSEIADPNDSETPVTEEWRVFDRNLFKSVAKGTSVLWLHIGQQFDNESIRSTNAADHVDSKYSNDTYQISLSDNVVKRARLELPVLFSPNTVVYRIKDRDFITSGFHQDGMVVQVRDAIGLTNRFIDIKDNAKFFLNLVRSICPPGSKIVFAEGSFDNYANTSVIDALGPWAVAIRFQFVVLLIVIFYTLGKRFGLARPDTVREPGTRELTDAIGALMHRKRKSNLAFRYLYADADARVRKALKLPAHASIKDRNARIPEELRYALNDVQIDNRIRTPAETLQAAQRLEQALANFLFELRRKR